MRNGKAFLGKIRLFQGKMIFV